MISRLLILSFVGLMLSINVNGQINYADSTVQAITYWNKADKITYKLSYDKYRVIHDDTISRVVMDYNVDVTVLDSTAHGYTIEWLYYNYTTTDLNPFVLKVFKSNEGNRIVFKTDEFGTFLEVINVDEILAFNNKSMIVLKEQLKETDLPDIDKILDDIRKAYNSKKSIESNAIKDILQYHNFYGAKYQLGEVYEGMTEVPNLMGDKPFDATIITSLEEINAEYETYRLFSSQTVDGEQLERGIKDYLLNDLKLSPEIVHKTTFAGVKNQINTVGIYDEYGWLLTGYQKVEVSLSDDTSVEERYIYIE